MVVKRITGKIERSVISTVNIFALHVETLFPCRSSHLEVICKKVFLKILQISQESTYARDSGTDIFQ